MDLILWRHAEAHVAKEGQDDLERALTPKGERQAQRMAEWLNQRLAHSTRILVSPARRCEQTALALGRKYKIRAELGPDAPPSQLLELVQWPNNKLPILVVGHQPTLGQVISQLLGLREEECAVKKGALWWLRYRQRESGAQTVVVTVQSPELL